MSMKSEPKVKIEGSVLPPPTMDVRVDRVQTHLSITVYLDKTKLDDGLRLLQQFANDHGLNMIYDKPANPRKDLQGNPVYPNNVILSGPIEQIEEAFSVKLYQYMSNDPYTPGTKYLTHYTDISLPKSLFPYVKAVLGLDNRPIVRPRSHCYS